MRNRIQLTALAGLMALAAAPAHAQLQFTLNPASQSYTQGQTATWSASFLNTGATTLTFAGISFSGLPAGLTVDDSLYFANFDAITLGAGASLTADLFTSTAALNLTPATYNSNVTVTYTGGAPSPNDASAVFTSVVSVAVPEPGTLTLLSAGFAGLLARRRRYQN